MAAWFGWWRSTVVRTSVYDMANSPWVASWRAVDAWPPLGKLSAVCQPTWPTKPFILFIWVDQWVVSWTQAFAMHMCVVAPSGECLRVKTDMMLFADNTMWSISESVRRSWIRFIQIDVTFCLFLWVTSRGRPSCHSSSLSTALSLCSESMSLDCTTTTISILLLLISAVPNTAFWYSTEYQISSGNIWPNTIRIRIV